MFVTTTQPLVMPPTFMPHQDLQEAKKRTHTIVLAGGRGSRLQDLTDRHAKPAIYFGGKFRVIDFALSNCMNSGLRRISVLTQYKSYSLMRHMQHGWNFFSGAMDEFIDVVPAQQRVDESQWYQGTADAVYQNLDIFSEYGAEYVLILAGDHVYKMDYGIMLEEHIQNGADLTIPCVEVPRTEATGFGVMHVDANRQIIDFLEKPANPPGMPGKPDRALASMGIYIFNAKFLYEHLRRDAEDQNSSHDFGKDIIPYLVPRAKVMAHEFSSSCVRHRNAEAYWRDVGTVDAYWEANLDLIKVVPQLDLYDSQWPIFTYQEQLPPAKFVFDHNERRGTAVDSIVSGGCIVSGSTVRRSVLFNNVRVHSFCQIENSVILPDVIVGRNAKLKNVVVDTGCHIPEGLTVGEKPEEDERRFYRTRKGIVLINDEMLKALK